MSGDRRLPAPGGIEMGVVPKRRRGIEVRERLFEAAMAEFEREGVEASRVDRVVAEVGTSWGTFFRYFPRKEDVLILAGVRHFREHVRPVVDQGLADPSRPRRDIARDAVAALVTSDRAPRLHGEMLSEITRHPRRFAAMLDEGELPLIGLFAALLADAQQRGEVREDIPPPVGATVLAAGVTFSTVQVSWRVAAGELPEQMIGQVASMAFETAWSGLEPRD